MSSAIILFSSLPFPSCFLFLQRQRDLEEHRLAITLSSGEVASADVDLERRVEELGHLELAVSLGPEGNERLLGGPGLHMLQKGKMKKEGKGEEKEKNLGFIGVQILLSKMMREESPCLTGAALRRWFPICTACLLGHNRGPGTFCTLGGTPKSSGSKGGGEKKSNGISK